jgi:hypothetical protein
MKRLKVLGLALVAAFALSAVAVASASAALPEFEGPFPNKVKTGTSGAGTLETKGGSKITCTSDTFVGEVNAAKEVKKVVVTFKGCETTILGIKVKCNTAGQAAGVVVTEPIHGTLGYTAKPKTGLDLEPEVGTTFATLECGGTKVTVKGDVVCEVSPTNVKTAKFKITCKQTKGVQEWTKLEGGAESVLKTKIGGGVEEQSGIENTEEIELEKESTIKA